MNHTYEIATRADRARRCTAMRADQHELAEHFGGTSEKDDPAKLVRMAVAPRAGRRCR